MPDVITGWQTEDFSRAPSGPGTPHHYLFTPDSPLDQIYSRRVTLSDGLLYLFRAYNLPVDRRIYMNLVSAEHAGSKADGEPLFGRDLYIQRMTLGGPEKWILTSDSPQMLVNLSGVYRFELENLDMLGADLCLEYSIVRFAHGAAPGVLR